MAAVLREHPVADIAEVGVAVLVLEKYRADSCLLVRRDRESPTLPGLENPMKC